MTDDELFRDAARILLGGGTLLGQPCPYCKGVRVMKNGHALCVSCGQKPETARTSESVTHTPTIETPSTDESSVDTASKTPREEKRSS